MRGRTPGRAPCDASARLEPQGQGWSRAHVGPTWAPGCADRIDLAQPCWL